MRNKRKIDTRDIGLRMAHILGRYVLKTEHLHYGYWPENLAVTLTNLPRAQELYAEFLLQHIPVGVKRILDVGCGTGHNAELLIARGYQVDGVSPSTYLSECARRKLPPESRIFDGDFETVRIPCGYDLVLFSESFQYMKMELALENSLRVLRPAGYIMIVDFFRIAAKGISPMGGGHRLDRFRTLVKEYQLMQLADIDITANTAPNLTLVDEALQQVAIPLKELLLQVAKSRFKIWYGLVRWGARLFWRKKIEKLNYKYFTGNRNAESFCRFKTYRLFLLQSD